GGEVQALADAVESRDGQPPLSDQALTQLQSDAARHVVAREGAELRGYAQLDGTSVEVVGDAGSVAELLDVLGDEAQLVWSHGRLSPVGPLLEARGFRRTRVLHQLRRSLLDALPDVPLAGGVTIRDFVPGVDEQAWLRVNAAAFATHAEQGRWTEADLAAREAEPWFDPAGFLLAERDGTVIGFHWTKIHGDGVGEVYVLGVDPAAQGLGLGPALLVRGLRHLTERGCSEVLLYVDESNGSAMRLYERFGFHTYDTDVQWTAGAVPDIPDATP
ncbi:MAG: mycothiol biosynthesis acetyltransferase, partial [Pseudonocardiales bacterium]|nr:mycothiol biosynthesis acetyltransferase [Pseudonocardiales bacterium]